MKQLKNAIMGTFVLLFLVGCGPKVTTTKTQDVDLSAYETFAYLPNGNFEDPSKGYDDSNVGEMVINEVNESMKELGYEMDRNQPDLLVLIGTKTDTDIERTSDPVYATYPNYYGVGYAVSPYYYPYYYYGYNAYTDLIGYDVDYDAIETGTLMLSLIDRTTREVVWRGTASDFVGDEQDAQAIGGFVDDLFAEFPKTDSAI